MNNKTLLSFVVFSSLIIPTFANAGLINQRIKLEGNLSKSIRLETDSKKGMSLNKGSIILDMETLENPISLLMPRLYLEQNGEVMAIKVPAAYYSNENDFTLKASDSGLNYDLTLEKSEAQGNRTVKLENEGCMVQKIVKLANDRQQFGVQKVQNTYLEIKETYKLIIGKDNEVAATITSNKNRVEKLESKLIEICK